MGIYSNKTRYIQELKIDGKKVKDDEEDFDLDPNKTKESDNKDDQPVEDKSTDDATNTEDEEDYKVSDEPEDEEDYEIPDDEGPEEQEEGTNDETEDNTEEENQDDNPDETDGETNDGSDNEDFKVEDSDGTGDDAEETGDGTDDIPDETTDGKSEIQSLEDNLFKDLTPEQMTIKQIELKQQYIDLFDSISDIVSRVNKITKTTDNANIIEFVTNKMSELKDLVHFYLNNTYITKSYIENTMNYQQYILILNTINKMLKEIIPKTDKSK